MDNWKECYSIETSTLSLLPFNFSIWSIFVETQKTWHSKKPFQQLKRFKDDVNEVKYGFECGLSLKGFNDIEIGDTLESFEVKEVKRKL